MLSELLTSKANQWPTVTDILDYQNPDLIDSFQEYFKVSRLEAENIFRETLKFLWLCKFEDKKISTIDQSMLIIDEMWHLFILYADEYEKFCMNYFGKVIKHRPTTPKEKEKFKSGRLNSEWKKTKKKKYEIIYDLLGHETFIKWFHEFPEIYTKDKILELRRK